MHIPHREDRNESQQLRRPRQYLDHSSTPEAVQDHILQILDTRLQFLVHLFQSSAVRITIRDQVLPGINKLTSLGVFDVPLLCQFPQEDFRYGTCEYYRIGILFLSNLGNVFVRVYMVDLVERTHSGEFFVGEGVD